MDECTVYEQFPMKTLSCRDRRLHRQIAIRHHRGTPQREEASNCQAAQERQRGATIINWQRDSEPDCLLHLPVDVAREQKL